MTRQRVQIDKKDRTILSLLYENKDISQEEIAKKINLSQPSVAMRIKKLRERGIIDEISGVNLNLVGLYVAQVIVRSTNPNKILGLFKDCPFFINGFIVSGQNNLLLMFAGEDLASLEAVIDGHIRADKDVQSADFNIVISSIKDYITPLKTLSKPLKNPPCGSNRKCVDCSAYKENRCFGCPATALYKGVFW